MPKNKIPSTPEELFGRWRMTRMSAWDNEFMNEESPAYVELDRDGGGEFHFGYVLCGIRWHAEERESRPGIAFTFEGHDEMHPTHGRGWAITEADGTLRGHIFFFHGDDSAIWGEKDRS